MDIKQEYSRLLNDSWQLVIEPKKFWQNRVHMAADSNVLVRFFLPLVLIVGVATFLGELLTGSEFLFSLAFARSMRQVVVYMLQFFAASYLTNELLPNFGGEKNLSMVKSVIAYSLFPFLLVSAVTGLFPALYVLGILNLYGVVLFVLGVQICLVLPMETKTRYIVISVVVNLITLALIDLICWKILQAIL